MLFLERESGKKKLLIFMCVLFFSVSGVPRQGREVCRNARCTFFLIHYHTTRFIFFKL